MGCLKTGGEPEILRSALGSSTLTDDQDILAGARELLAAEAQALSMLGESLDTDFARAARLLAACEGRVVTSGVGKAGIIARKIGATLASTGTPADFLHPTEALHGDLGRVTPRDLVLALSNSGNTEEILRLVGPLRDVGVSLVAITANRESPLAQHADIVLAYGAITEVCPLGLAPTTSTTVMLALGDALAMEVLKLRAFSTEEFARFHPGGNLGRSLMKVDEVMRKGESLPIVRSGATLAEAVGIMTTTPGRPGSVLVVGEDARFQGFYTDGDLRRCLLTAQQTGNLDMMLEPIDKFMTKEPITIGPHELVADGLRLLRERQIDQLGVVDDTGKPVGLLDIQDLLNMRVLSWGPSH
jgi:arabinose-5-phosphate isomerase